VKKSPSAPVEKQGESAKAKPAAGGMSTTLIVAGGALLLIAFLVGWFLRRREKPEPADTVQTVQPALSIPSARWDADDDETVFMPDEEDTPRVDIEATLTVIESENLKPGQVFRFSGTTRIGRTAKNDINLPDKTVSRKHAEIYFENNAYYIRDLGSQNGLKVNEKRVRQGGTLLATGARIRFSPKTLLEFNWRTGAVRSAVVDPDDSTEINE
jgi:LPXTG-motif cell wall-anchored protein